MAGESQIKSNVGLFVPTTNVWDISHISTIEVTDPQFKDIIVSLYQNINNIALSLNKKDTGIYTNQEFLNGQEFFPNPSENTNTISQPRSRQIYRMVVNFGTLPNNTTKSVAHGIAATQSYSFTRIYGVASNKTSKSYLPLPYASATGANVIELSADGTNVTIITGKDQTAYTTTYVILEYIKQ